MNVDVVLFTLSKTEKELEYLKNKYDKELLKYKKTYKDNKIYLTPHIGTFDDYKTKTLFLTYYLKPSSGNGEERELLEIVEIPSNDENTRSHDFKKLININESNEEEIYKKILKQYPPTMFVDYKPTKKQLKRNKDAEIFEGMGEYDEAIKLYEKNVSEKCGSPTTYKKLIRIYKKLNNPSRILELIEEAIPVFTTLNNKKMVLNLIYYRNDAIRQKDDIRYLKILSIEENDYLYENCCVDDANKIVLKKIEELESKTTGGYFKGGYWTED